MSYCIICLGVAISFGCSQVFAQAFPDSLPQLKTSPPTQVATEEVPQEISFLGIRLALASTEKEGNGQLWEYVSPDEQITEWTVLYAVRRFQGDHLDAQSSVMVTAKNIEERKKTDDFANCEVYRSEKDGSWMIDFLVSENDELFEHNLFRYFEVQGGLVSHQYARRAYVPKEEGEPPRRYLWSRNPGQKPILELLASIGEQREQFLKELLREDLPFSADAIPPTPVVFPTPKMAVMFDMDSALGEWEMKTLDGNSERIHWQFGPRGKSEWDGLLTQDVHFNAGSVETFVETWKRALREEDPQIEISQRMHLGSAVTVSFRSSGALGAGISKFMQGPDGIYVLAYNVRPDFGSGSQRQAWSKIIGEASLVPNPMN